MTPSLKKLLRRSSTEIIRLLQDKQIKNYNISAFCKKQGISHQTFYNWEKNGSHPLPVSDFIPLMTASPENVHPAPFCEVVIADKTTIRFFNTVDAKYLKSLIS